MTFYRKGQRTVGVAASFPLTLALSRQGRGNNVTVCHLYPGFSRQGRGDCVAKYICVLTMIGEGK